jgi:hypothetical protein
MSRRYIKLPHPGCNPAANDNALPELGELAREIAVLEWAAEKFGRASEDDETAQKLRFALSVVISKCVKDTVVAECADRDLSPPDADLIEGLAVDVAELTAAPLAQRVIRRLQKSGADAH